MSGCTICGRGLSLPIIGALLGHKHATTTARSAHLSADPLRAANDAVGAKIAAAMSRKADAIATADVVNLPSRRIFERHKPS